MATGTAYTRRRSREPMKHVNTLLPQPVYLALKIYAVTNGRVMHEVFTEAVRRYLAVQPPERP